MMWLNHRLSVLS